MRTIQDPTQRRRSSLFSSKPEPAQPQVEPLFAQFSRLPVELQLAVWTNAAQSPRIVEVWGYGWDLGRSRNNAVLRGHRPTSGWKPFFSIHPLIHTCRNSREVYRSLHEQRLPDYQKEKARGKHWVFTSECAVKCRSSGLDDELVGGDWAYWLNFDGERDVFFDNCTTSLVSHFQGEWLTRCDVKHLACDVRNFYWEMPRVGGMGIGWRYVHAAPCIEDLTLVLVPQTRAYERAKAQGWPVEFLDPDDRTTEMSVSERRELEEYRELTRVNLPQKREQWPGWTPPLIKWAYARRRPTLEHFCEPDLEKRLSISRRWSKS